MYILDITVNSWCCLRLCKTLRSCLVKNTAPFLSPKLPRCQNVWRKKSLLNTIFKLRYILFCLVVSGVRLEGGGGIESISDTVNPSWDTIRAMLSWIRAFPTLVMGVRVGGKCISKCEVVNEWLIYQLRHNQPFQCSLTTPLWTIKVKTPIASWTPTFCFINRKTIFRYDHKNPLLMTLIIVRFITTRARKAQTVLEYPKST
ncbi:hypothetical protein CEXT_617241 [Caerostris extrusa]|uniref:Uncharacterized protein n=1 Tax=Caerostris extrusa TaxID=172846 RepID=A0AAV4XTZ7_CAEEX|nr:hypothetical protein CEXT_617241 [Caerostris extrusa]